MNKILLLRNIKSSKCGGLCLTKQFDEDVVALLEKVGKYIFVKKSPNSCEKSLQVESSSTVQPFIPMHKERFQIFISGESGSGKGIMASIFCEQYHTLYEKQKIYYLCPTKKENDINLNQKYITDLDFDEIENIAIDQLANSLVVIDDVDFSKNHKKAIAFLNMISETGRKFNTSLIFISHRNTNANESTFIKELDLYVTNMENLMNNRLLIHYLQIQSDLLMDIKKMKPAFIAVNKQSRVIITDKTIETY